MNIHELIADLREDNQNGHGSVHRSGQGRVPRPNPGEFDFKNGGVGRCGGGYRLWSGAKVRPASGWSFLRPPIATFWRPDEWAQVLTRIGCSSGRLRSPHMHTEWRPEEFRALSGSAKLDKRQFGSNTPPLGRARTVESRHAIDSRRTTRKTPTGFPVVRPAPARASRGPHLRGASDRQIGRTRP